MSSSAPRSPKIAAKRSKRPFMSIPSRLNQPNVPRPRPIRKPEGVYLRFEILHRFSRTLIKADACSNSVRNYARLKFDPMLSS